MSHNRTHGHTGTAVAAEPSSRNPHATNGISKSQHSTNVGQNPSTSTRALGAQPSTNTTTTSSSSSSSIARQQDNWIKARQIHQQQLLTEHFGFSPLSFVDDVINSVNNMIYQASMALQEYVESQYKEMENQNPEADIDVALESGKCMHTFETLLESSVDKNFDRFELYALKNLFGVPEAVDIVLPHYEALDFGIGIEREQKLDEQLEVLRRRVIATKALNYKLRKELEIEEKRRRQLQKCREQIQFLKDAVNEYGDVAPVPQTLIFVRDNIETLHRRFQALHDRLQQNANRHTIAASALTAPSQASSSSTLSSSDSVTLALHETLLGLEPDPRSIYIRSVVRRQVDDHLAEESASTAMTGGGGHYRAPPTP